MASLLPISRSPVFAKSLLNRGVLRSFLLPRSFFELEDRSFSQILRTASLSRSREFVAVDSVHIAGIVKSQYTVDIPDVSLSEFVMSNFHEHGRDIAVYLHRKDIEWSEKHDVVLCREVLVMEPYQHPYRSKERGDVWNQIALDLNGLDHPKFKVNKRSARDRLTLLITKHKAKMRHEENASEIDCEETELDQAIEEIIDKKLADEKSLEAKKKEKEEKAAEDDHRKIAMKRLGQTKKRNAERENAGTQTKKSRRSSSDGVQYLKEKNERESDQRKEELELRKKEQQASVELQKEQQQQQQTQILLSLLAQRK